MIPHQALAIHTPALGQPEEASRPRLTVPRRECGLRWVTRLQGAQHDLSLLETQSDPRWPLCCSFIHWVFAEHTLGARLWGSRGEETRSPKQELMPWGWR